MLRYLERDGWDCDTACEKVVELVLALASTLESDMSHGEIWRSCWMVRWTIWSIFKHCKET